MRVREGGRGDQQRPGPRDDPAILVEELGLARLERVVEVDRPQHDAVQRLVIVAAPVRVELAVPVRIAALVGQVLLQVDAAGPRNICVTMPSSVDIVQRGDVVGGQGDQPVGGRILALELERGDRDVRIAPQIAAEPVASRRG